MVNTDNFGKLRSMIKDLNNKILKHSFKGENKSINESMIPYFGTNGSRQRINNKPTRVGYKFRVLADAYAKVGKQIVSQTRWELGEKFELDLMECLLIMFTWITFLHHSI